MSKIIGVDFGTANYRMAVMDGSFPSIISDRDGHTVFPSVVACTKGKQWLVGKRALQQANENLGCTFFSIKNLLDSEQLIDVQGTSMKPAEIIAEIFEKIKRDAEQWLGSPVIDIVISYPPIFSIKTRYELRLAAELAFFKVKRMITNTNAIALYYSYLNKPDQEYWMVFDMGAGSFSLGIYEMGDGVTYGRAVDGNSFLNGNAIDKLIFDYCLREFENMHGISCMLDHLGYMKLYHHSELSKVLLSDVEVYRITIPSIMKDNSGKVYDLDVKIRRNVLDGLLNEKFIKELDRLIENSLRNSGFAKDDFTKLIVSGSTMHLPLIRQKMIQFIGEKRLQMLDSTAVVLGAAIMGGSLTGEVKDELLLECIPRGFGLLMADRTVVEMISSDTIPCRRSESFIVEALKRTHLFEVHIIETIGCGQLHNEVIGTMVIPHQLAEGDQVLLRITFDIDANNTLTVETSLLDHDKSYILKLPVNYKLPSLANLTSLLIEIPEEKEND
jgi:molecular chaperone DnaK